MTDLAVRAVMTGDNKGLVGAAKGGEDSINNMRAATQRFTSEQRQSTTASDAHSESLKRGANSAGLFENQLGRLGSRLVSTRQLFGPLVAAFSASSALRFGEHIVTDIDDITEHARQLGIVVGDDTVRTLHDAATGWDKFWARVEAGAAEAAAHVIDVLGHDSEAGKLLDKIDSEAGKLLDKIDSVFGNAMTGGAYGRVGAQDSVTLRIVPTPYTGKGWDVDGNAKAAEDEAGRQTIFDDKKKALDDAANYQQDIDRRQLEIDNDNANGTIALGWTIAREKKSALDDAANYQQTLDQQQLEIDNENAAATEDLRQKIFNDKKADLDRAFAYEQEQAARVRDIFSREIANDVVDFGDAMDRAGGKFGKAIGSMIEDLAKLGLRLMLTKELEESLGDVRPGSILSSIGNALGFGGGSGFQGTVAGFDGIPDVTITPGLFHEGGIVRAHSGKLLTDEVPVIAKKGEGIFTPEQMDNADSLLSGAMQDRPAVVVNVSVQTLPGTTAKVDRQVDANGNVDLRVVVEQVQRQIAQDMGKGQSAIGHAAEAIYGLKRRPG